MIATGNHLNSRSAALCNTPLQGAGDVLNGRFVNRPYEDGMDAEVGAAAPARRTVTTASPKKGRISPSGGNDVSRLKFLLFLQIFYIITGFC